MKFLVTDEREFAIQTKLIAVRDALTNLTGNPAEPSYQTTYSQQFEALKTALSELIDTYDAAQRERIFALGARLYFSTALTQRINSNITQNPLSPAVTLDVINKLITQRDAYLDRIRTTLKGLQNLELDESELSEGEADVGFEVPRTIFGNKLNGMIQELRTIQRIIRVFSEVRTGSVTEIEVHDISASDPIFFLGSGPIKGIPKHLMM